MCLFTTPSLLHKSLSQKLEMFVIQLWFEVCQIPEKFLRPLFSRHPPKNHVTNTRTRSSPNRLSKLAILLNRKYLSEEFVESPCGWKRILDAKIRKVFWEYASRGLREYGAWNPFWHWFDFSINQRVASFQWSICCQHAELNTGVGYILGDYILQIWYLIDKEKSIALTSLLQILSS